MRRDTLKQLKFKKELRNSNSLWEAAMKAGYSPYSKTIYQQRTNTHAIAEEVFREVSEEKIKSDFEIAKDLALETKDLTNFNRANEDLARIKAMFTDKSEVKAEIINKEEADILSKLDLTNEN